MMDEHREEREELEALVRDDEDDAREQGVRWLDYSEPHPSGLWRYEYWVQDLPS